MTYFILFYTIGFLVREEPSLRCFTAGDMINLKISISNDSLSSHIRELTWYHNGTQVTNSSRVTVQDDGKELVVHNALSRDAGKYRVEVTTLNFTDDPCCHETWLFFLKNHAAYAPVTFTAREWGVSCKQNTSKLI